MEGTWRPGYMEGTWRPGYMEAKKELLSAPLTLFALGPAQTKPQDGSTPLYVAAGRGHLEVTKELLRRGAKVNRQNNVSVLQN